MVNRKYPDHWYLLRNPSKLREYWYQIYFQQHCKTWGFEHISEPKSTGPDFIAMRNGRRMRIEVERDCLCYLDHGHHKHKDGWADVLVVGFPKPPPSDMRPMLPREIIYIDPDEVDEDTQPQRFAYWQAKEQERQTKTQQQERWEHEAELVPLHEFPDVFTEAGWNSPKWKWAIEHPGLVIREVKRLDDDVRIFLKVNDWKDWEPCPCGEGVLEPDGDSWDLEENLTEGQTADQMASELAGDPDIVWRCKACGRTEIRC